MGDQRTFERFDLRVPARLGIEEAGQKKKEVPVHTANICAGGAFFQTEETLPEGTRVVVDLVLSIDKLKDLLECSQCRVLVKGEVVRTGEKGIAVRFDSNYEIVPVRVAMH